MIRQTVYDENRNLYYDSPKDDNRNMDNERHTLYHDNKIWMIMRHEITIDVPHWRSIFSSPQIFRAATMFNSAKLVQIAQNCRNDENVFGKKT